VQGPISLFMRCGALSSVGVACFTDYWLSLRVVDLVEDPEALEGSVVEGPMLHAGYYVQNGALSFDRI
jgi:hypothetical protein